MNFDRQTTLRAAVTLAGIGVHSGAPASICLKPSSANSGVVFLRTGIEGMPPQLIHAKHTKVSATELCTVIGDRGPASVSTIEHLMSACAGLGLDNVLVEIDGPEMPIMDGSATAFVTAIEATGIVMLGAAASLSQGSPAGARRERPRLRRADAGRAAASASTSRSISTPP